MDSDDAQRVGSEGRYEFLHIASPSVDGTNWRVDGILGNADNAIPFLRGRITDINIGGLEALDHHSTSNSIWVQTHEGAKSCHWYRLNSPCPGYESYWFEFLWLADFMKFFLDFLDSNSSLGRSVRLADFKLEFWTWLQSLHGSKIHDWHEKCGGKTDFRHFVLAHFQFLRHQAYNLHKGKDNPRFSHQIWQDIAAGLFSHDRKCVSNKGKTVVTQHVASSFLKTFPHWQSDHHLLKVVKPCPEVELFAVRRRQQWKLPSKLQYDQSPHFRGDISRAAWILEDLATSNQALQIRSEELLHKVVVVRKPLKDRGHYDFRYAWVHQAFQAAVSVTWLLLPSETLCGSAEEGTYYPVGNELFLSDECNCQTIPIRNIVGAIDASMFTDHAEEGCDLFVYSCFNKDSQTHTRAGEENLSRCQQHSTYPAQLTSNLRQSKIQSQPKMTICALCSGCGLLDHAFSEGANAETALAVEHSEAAASSHKANNDSRQCEYLIDSVNQVLRDYISGVRLLPSHIDAILAGCPCQGWSTLNPTKGSGDYKSQKNCSILANMLSWIEIFLPAFILIENVPNMDSCRPNACAQAICQLVAMGYQVRKSVKVDSKVGGFSTRKRLFIVAAAPGAVLPNDLPETDNQLHSAGDAIKGLQTINNDTVLNHLDPDHIPLKQMRIDWPKEVSFRDLLTKIKTSLSQAYYAGRLSKPQRKFFRSLNDVQRGRASKCLKRVNADIPFRTMATLITPMDARFGGEIVHPHEHRLLSLREVARSMGAPDSFLLVGTITEKAHQLGNGVPWALGRGWGVRFAKAWAETWGQSASQPDQMETLGVTAIEGISTPAFAAAEKVARPSTMRTRRQLRTVPDDSDSDDTPSEIEVVIPRATSSGTPSTTTARTERRRTTFSDDSDSDSDIALPRKRRPQVTKGIPSATARDSTGRSRKRPHTPVYYSDSDDTLQVEAVIPAKPTIATRQKPVHEVLVPKRKAPEQTTESSDDDLIYVETRVVKKLRT